MFPQLQAQAAATPLPADPGSQWRGPGPPSRHREFCAFLMPLGLYSMGPFRTHCSAGPRAPPVSPAYHVNGFSAVNKFLHSSLFYYLLLLLLFLALLLSLWDLSSPTRD